MFPKVCSETKGEICEIAASRWPKTKAEVLFDMRSDQDIRTHTSGVQMYSFDKEDNLFGKYPYKSYPQLKFKESELPARFTGSIHKLRKNGEDLVLHVKHHTSYLEANDPETGQYNVALLNDETVIDDEFGTWK
jgi:hypothetical protein